MSLPYDRTKIPRAKELRKNMTPQERKIWYQYLSSYPVRFQRQKTIDGFIVDFYCAKALLVIEVDGRQHEREQGLAYDSDRSNILMKHYIKVIRFTNEEVDANFGSVCRDINDVVNERTVLLRK